MLVEFPDDLKTLITAAKGDKTLKAFASEAGISYPKLYRLIEHKIKRLVDDDTLKAIADHAAPESGVTFEALKEACAFVVESNKSWEDEQKELYKRRKAAVTAIHESIFNSHVIKSVSPVTHPHSSDLTDPAAAPYFDRSMMVTDKNGREENLYFHVTNHPLGWDTADILESFIGRIFLRAQPQSNERYYLVVINDQKEKGNKYKLDRIKEFEEACQSLEPVFVVTGERDKKEVEQETKILSAIWPDKDADISVDARIKEYVINASVIIVTYDDAENYPYLTEVVISNEDRVIVLDDWMDIQYVFSENFQEENVWVAPHVRTAPYIDKAESTQPSPEIISDDEKGTVE